MTMQLIDRTDWTDADLAAWDWFTPPDRADAPIGQPTAGADGPARGYDDRHVRRSEGQIALAAFLDRRWRLPTCARTYAFHGLAGLGAVDQWLVDTLRPLQGKFTVVNNAVVVSLPAAARRRAARLLAAAWNRARRDGRRIAVGFSEEQRPVVRHEVTGVRAAGDPGPDVRFVADLRYHLTVALEGRDDGGVAAVNGVPDHADLQPRLVSRPAPWFDLPVLIPDADALRLMAPETQLLYRSITGRAGPASRDRYWYADSWERFHEPGRVAGCIQPAAVEYAAAVESGSPEAALPEVGDDLFLYGAAGSGERSRWTDYSSTTHRRLFVPPGYCLVRFACWAEVALADRR